MSDWNLFMERLLDLDVAEYRLAVTLGRSLLGFRKRSEHLGRALLRERSRLDGRSLDRALAGLVDKGLVAYTPGKPGRGHRARYELLLLDDESTEMAAPERPFTPAEKTPEKAARRPQKRPLQSGHEEKRPRREKPFDINNTRGDADQNGDSPDWSEVARVFGAVDECSDWAEADEDDTPDVVVDHLSDWNLSKRLFNPAAFETTPERVLALFNKLAKTDFRAEKHLRKIKARIAERPELDLADHAELIAHALFMPWFRGDPSPAVVYASQSAHDSAVSRFRKDDGWGPQKDLEAAHDAVAELCAAPARSVGVRVRKQMT